MLLPLFDRLGEGLGAAFAIDGTRNDAPCIAGPLATGIEALYGDMVKQKVVARDAPG